MENNKKELCRDCLTGKSAEFATCAFCRNETSVSRQYLHAKNKPQVGDGFDFIRYCNECGLKEIVSTPKTQ